MKISVITPTIRKEGLDIVRLALKNQTFRDFEWIIGSPFDPDISGAISVIDYFDGDNTINRVYNALIRESKSDCIVTLQDFTYIKPDALERFWFHFLDNPKRIVGAVGNKYTSVYPELGAIIWKDPRIRLDMGSFYECMWQDVEWNCAMFPKQAILDVGGFEEKMDRYWGLDGYNVNERLEELGGYVFYLDQTINTYSLSHGRVDTWDQNNWMKDDRYVLLKKDLAAHGKWPNAGYL